jgi:pimeloyl-ACP methyl ester carboxylesterase
MPLWDMPWCGSADARRYVLAPYRRTGSAEPVSRLRTIKTPTLVMHGSKTDARLKKAAQAVAAALPNAKHRVLPGQTHNVHPKVLTPAVMEFLRG